MLQKIIKVIILLKRFQQNMALYDFNDIKERIAQFSFTEDFDLIVAVANGGIIPSAMLAQRLEKDMQLLRISLRDSSQRPIYDSPIQVGDMPNVEGKRILLVEDRVKSGASLALAKRLLEEAGAAKVSTFAVNGKADYSLLDVPCFRFPWLM